MLFFLMGLGAGNKTYYLWKHKGDYFIIEQFCKYISHQVLAHNFIKINVLRLARIDGYCRRKTEIIIDLHSINYLYASLLLLHSHQTISMTKCS